MASDLILVMSACHGHVVELEQRVAGCCISEAESAVAEYMQFDMIGYSKVLCSDSRSEMTEIHRMYSNCFEMGREWTSYRMYSMTAQLGRVVNYCSGFCLAQTCHSERTHLSWCRDTTSCCRIDCSYLICQKKYACSPGCSSYLKLALHGLRWTSIADSWPSCTGGCCMHPYRFSGTLIHAQIHTMSSHCSGTPQWMATFGTSILTAELADFPRGRSSCHID